MHENTEAFSVIDLKLVRVHSFLKVHESPTIYFIFTDLHTLMTLVLYYDALDF
jgi:hypothetical protein